MVCVDKLDVRPVSRNAAYLSVSPLSLTLCQAVVTPLTVSAPAAITSTRPPHNSEFTCVGVIAMPKAVVFSAVAEAPRQVALGCAPVSTLTHNELPRKLVPVAGV
jgi:hypothetical protein